MSHYVYDVFVWDRGELDTLAGAIVSKGGVLFDGGGGIEGEGGVWLREGGEGSTPPVLDRLRAEIKEEKLLELWPDEEKKARIDSAFYSQGVFCTLESYLDPSNWIAFLSSHVPIYLWIDDDAGAEEVEHALESGEFAAFAYSNRAFASRDIFRIAEKIVEHYHQAMEVREKVGVELKALEFMRKKALAGERGDPSIFQTTDGDEIMISKRAVIACSGKDTSHVVLDGGLRYELAIPSEDFKIWWSHSPMSRVRDKIAAQVPLDGA